MMAISNSVRIPRASWQVQGFQDFMQELF